MKIEIRVLTPTDDRSAFTCGEPALDRYFRDYAGQNQFELGLAVTYVAVLDEAIIGFVTVSIATLERADLPSKKLKRRLPAYPIPVLRLARLGTHAAHRGKGIGRALLHHVFDLASKQRDTLGCLGVLVDAKPDARAYYESFGFVPLDNVQEGRVHGAPLPMFLSLSTIEAAR